MAKRAKKSGARGVDRSDVAQKAAKEYAEQNPEIILAIEAMQRSQLVQENRVEHILKPQSNQWSSRP